MYDDANVYVMVDDACCHDACNEYVHVWTLFGLYLHDIWQHGGFEQRHTKWLAFEETLEHREGNIKKRICGSLKTQTKRWRVEK